MHIDMCAYRHVHAEHLRREQHAEGEVTLTLTLTLTLTCDESSTPREKYASESRGRRVSARRSFSSAAKSVSESVSQSVSQSVRQSVSK